MYIRANPTNPLHNQPDVTVHVMNEKEIEKLLRKVQKGSLSVGDAVQNFKRLPFEDLGFAHIDHHRALRKGFPEVVFGKGETAGI